MGEYADYEIDRVIEGFERRSEKKKFQCECGKRFSTEQAMKDHSRDSRCGKNEAIQEDSCWENSLMSFGEEQDFGA